MFARKNRKAQGVEHENIINIILWIVFILFGGAAIYFILKKITAG